jgi:hypothetical protein
MMRRHSVPTLVLLLSAAFSFQVYAQATPAKQTSPAPATPAKWMPPLKGEGTVEVIKGQPRRVGNDMVTTMKVKNTSKSPLALLTVDEYWYGSASADAVSGDTQRYKALLAPGDVAEITMRSPFRADMNRSQILFKHANGSIKAKQVAKFVDDKPK